VQEVLLLNKFFSDCRLRALFAKIQPDKLYDGAQMATFWQFFASYVSSKPRAARFRPVS